MDKKRIVYFDVLKVLAFSAIIYYHMMVEMVRHDILPEVFNHDLYMNSNLHLATTAVALFFMLSGAGLMTSAERSSAPFSIGTYFKKRVVRILIPYYIMSLAVFFINHGGHVPEGIAPWTLVFNLLAMDGFLANLGFPVMSLGVGEWFMGCIVIMYLVFPLLRLLLKKCPVPTLVLATAAALIYGALYPWPIPYYQDLFLKMYEFLLGMALATVWQKLSRKWGCLWALLFAALALWPTALPVPGAWLVPVSAVLLFMLGASLDDSFSKMPRLSGFVKTAGTYAYDIFLVHHLVIILCLEKLWIARGMTDKFGLLFALDVVVIIIAGVCLHYISDAVLRGVTALKGAISGKTARS
ncbi:MAG: acyltransferase [Lachnospiraceae bacterium]|nr:acyltransferase [Lachnospiraceae bacterium]